MESAKIIRGVNAAQLVFMLFLRGALQLCNHHAIE